MRHGSVARIALLALLWGSNYLWIKVALRGFSPVQITFARLALGALVLLPVVYAGRRRLPRGGRLWLRLFVAALLGNALPYLLVAVGEARIDSGVAGVLNATTPLCTLVFALVSRVEPRLTATRAAGLALGFAGALVVFSPWSAASAAASWGGLAVLATSVSYGLSWVYMHGRLTGLGIAPVTLAAAQLTASAVLLAVTVPVAGLQSVHARADAITALVVLGALGTGAAYILNYRLIADEGPTTTATVTYLLPVIAVVLGAVTLSEPLSAHVVAGTTTILVGVALANRNRPTRDSGARRHDRPNRTNKNAGLAGR